MIRLFAESYLGLKAVGRALAFREDWAEPLNLTYGGLIRSFFAAILAIPVMWFVMQAFLRLTMELAPEANPDYTAVEFVRDLARIWLVFPIVAILLTRLTGTGHRFIHWLILHNWAVLFLFLIQGFLATLYLAGISSANGTAFTLAFGYTLLRFFVHIRVAVVALKLPVFAAAALGLIPVLIDFLIIQLV